jgi:hypothetical protein
MAEVSGSILPGSITDQHIAPLANLAASKLQHQYAKTFSQPLTAATSETRVIHVCKGAVGEVVAFKAGSIGVAVGNATVTVDLKKNGVSILTAVITLDVGNTTYIVEEAALSFTALAAGDVLSVTTVATIGTGTLPTGVFAEAVLRENA